MKKSKQEKTEGPGEEGLPNHEPNETQIAGEASAPVAAFDAKALEELKATAATAAEHWDRLLRTTAEFDNFRKRAAREKDDAIRYANQNLMDRLLPVLDGFEMAMASVNAQDGEGVRPLKEGMNMVLQQFRSVLSEAGLQEIDAQGKPFDPNLHEAVSQIETDEMEDGHVFQQLRKGYQLRDRLVRPATVVVARKPGS